MAERSEDKEVERAFLLLAQAEKNHIAYVAKLYGEAF